MKLFLRRSLVFVPLLAVANYCAAISVDITFIVNETCSYANGSMYASVSGGVPPYTFVWGDGPTTQERTGLSAGTYSVTVTDAISAQATDQATIISTGYDIYNYFTYPYCNSFGAYFNP